MTRLAKAFQLLQGGGDGETDVGCQDPGKARLDKGPEVRAPRSSISSIAGHSASARLNAGALGLNVYPVVAGSSSRRRTLCRNTAWLGIFYASDPRTEIM